MNGHRQFSIGLLFAASVCDILVMVVNYRISAIRVVILALRRHWEARHHAFVTGTNMNVPER